jgi:hypothetical protein
VTSQCRACVAMPARTGPPVPSSLATPANLSAEPEANVCAAARPAGPSRFTQNQPEARTARSVAEPQVSDSATWGGSALTLTSEVAVIPAGRPASSYAVTIVTPPARLAIAST